MKKNHYRTLGELVTKQQVVDLLRSLVDAGKPFGLADFEKKIMELPPAQSSENKQP